MEAATVEAKDNHKPDATKSVEELFRFSGYVHVGPGAAECEHGPKGTCTDEQHWHAWCRLPNPLQHEDILKRARAARARTIRQHRDPESEAYMVIEGDMDELRREADAEKLAEFILSFSAAEDQLAGMREVEAREEFEHHSQDIDRWREINLMDLDQQPAEELAELQRHLEAYGEAVREEVDRLRQPRRDALAALPVEDLVAQIREKRIDAEGAATFENYYAMHQWFACTLKPVASGRPRERIFESVTELSSAAPEVISALRTFFRELEMGFQRGATGN